MITTERVTELTCALVSIPSITGREAAVGDWIEAFCQRVGFPHIKRLPTPEAGDTLIAWTDAPPGAPAMMLNFHQDTFAPSLGWSHDPWQPQVVGNRVSGIGAHDMKGGAAAVLAAVEELLGAPGTLPGKLILAATSDEENWSRGAHAVLQSGLAADARYCLIPEPTIPGTLRIGARGRHVIHLQVQGVRANASYGDSGINPIADAARIASRICDTPSIDLGYAELFDMRGTFNIVGMHAGGTDVLWPELADIYIDQHILPGNTIEQTAEQLHALIAEVGIAGRYALTWDERPTPAPRAYQLPLNSRFVQVVQQQWAGASGRSIRPTLGRSVCDANHFAAGGIPTIVCGPHGGNTAEANEWVEIDSIVAVAETYVHATRELLGAT